jgi:hypothetical protein
LCLPAGTEGCVAIIVTQWEAVTESDPTSIVDLLDAQFHEMRPF